MALAAAAHHSAQPNAAPRGQKPGTRAKEGEVREEHQALRGQTRLPPGMRPALLVEVQPQGHVKRHFAEHMAELAPLVQILDAPVPQLVDNVMDAFRFLDLPMTEQVIEVPRISCPPCPFRSRIPVPQTAEQLVDVPTVLSPTRISLQVAEQIINTPVQHVRVDGGGLQGSLSGQGLVGEQIVGIPVPQGRRGKRRGHGFLPVQSSTAASSSLERISERTVEQTVGISPGGGVRGLQGFSPGQASTTFPPTVRISERIMEQNVDILGGGGVQGFLTRQSSAALSEQVPVSAVHAATAPVGEFMASAPSVHAAPAPLVEYTSPGSAGDDASRVEQDTDVEGVDYLGRVVYHSGTCEMLDMVDFKWRSLGEGTYPLLGSSEGAKDFHFQFWRRRQLLVDDFVSGLVLRGGSKGLSLRWRNPEFEDGPSDYRHAVRFQSPVQASRLYDEWNSS